MRAKTSHLIPILLVAVALSVALPVSAASFVYRGALTDRGTPAEGAYGFRLTFYDAQFGGKALAAPITLDGVSVNKGAFNASLDLEPALQRRDNLWLEVEVRAAGGAFEPMADREAVQPKALAAGICWDTTGNAGTVAGTNYLGTTDNVALDLRANGLRALRVEPSASGGPNVIGGPSVNAVTAGVYSATIAGGGDVGEPNHVYDVGGVVGGGLDNSAGSNDGSGISAASAVVAGGVTNRASAAAATVSGGNTNTASGLGAVVPGGFNNTAAGIRSFAAGNRAKVFAADGGTFIWADNQGLDFGSTAPNQFLVRASGGVGINTANGPDNTGALLGEATIKPSSGDGISDLILLAPPATPGPGSERGFDVNAQPDGHFYVSRIAGSSGSGYTFSSAFHIGPPVTAFDTYSFSFGRSSANVAGAVFQVGTGGNTGGNGAFLSSGGTWTNTSSRALKEGFAAIDPMEILAKVVELPISTWTYKSSLEGRHLGPVAEDFKAAFGLAGDGKSIGTVDADGVALAAIQGLNEKLEHENRLLRQRNDGLEARLVRIESLLSNGGGE